MASVIGEVFRYKLPEANSGIDLFAHTPSYPDTRYRRKLCSSRLAFFRVQLTDDGRIPIFEDFLRVFFCRTSGSIVAARSVQRVGFRALKLGKAVQKNVS